MKRLFLALVTVAVCCIAYAQQNKNDTVRREVLLQTNMGNIRIALGRRGKNRQSRRTAPARC